MFEFEKRDSNDKQAFYQLLTEQAAALLRGEPNPIANAANLAALIFDAVPDINWAGFYFFDGEELVLGPFMGKPACVRIAIGKGVCGTAAATRKSQLVEDVHAFPGHIACDSASNSEIVVPLFNDDKLVGVLDIDSPSLNRFDSKDLSGFERLATIWTDMSDIPADGRLYK